MVTAGAHGLVADPAGANYVYATTIAELARTYRLPVLSAYAEHARYGGLVSYTTDLDDQFRRMADQVDRIFKGENAGDLPIHGPTRFKLIINSKAAHGLGLSISPALLIRADEVIE
jgi:putative tryptophan/tyrosine transport system substrate-binding protein